jgi:hypothetical protein
LAIAAPPDRCKDKSAHESKRFERAPRKFAQRFKEETEATLECFEDDQASLNIKGSDELLEHAEAISAGFYFGFVESSLLAAAKAFGLTRIAADLVGSSAQDTIRNESMYFLWKVRHRAQRN